MAIPGFQAEMSVYQRSTAYAMGPQGGTDSDRIAPMFTKAELQRINQCEGGFERCAKSCEEVLEYRGYGEWSVCYESCKEDERICLGNA
ncbi:hypothetical protein ACFWJ4_30560 [Kitasatospora sp. NPDC127067]|uniref:hypothetical protein n=1 Tax=Kitasatospora sp. NPDC127067 TaxID=3347126 RepID=UPI003661F2AC